LQKVRVGLIGYKFMGKAHSHAFFDVGKFFPLKVIPELKVICGRNLDGVKQAAERYGWETYETDWRRLVKRDDIDLIDIVTPNNVHKEIVIEAARNGKHILCEKPLAMNLREAKEMVKAVERAKVIHMVCFNYRKVPAIALIKQMIKDGKLGRIYHWRAVYLQDWIVDPNFPLVWRLTKNVCGSGVLGDLCSHIIDLSRYLIGEIAEVCGMWETFIKQRPLPSEMSGLSARGSKKKGKVDVDDATIFLVKFKNGAMGSFEATRFATGHKNGEIIEINGSKGSVIFNMERMNELQYYSREDEKNLQGWRTIQVTESFHPYMSAWWPVGHIIGYEHTFIHLIYDLLNAIAENKLPEPNFYDGLKCQEVMERVVESIKTKKWVKVR